MAQLEPEGQLDDNAAALASALAMTGRTRFNQRYTRVIIGFFGAVVLWFSVTPVAAILWSLLVAATQLLDLYAWRNYRDPKTAKAPDRSQLAFLCVASTLACIAYGGFALLIWNSPHFGSKLFGVMWLCGAMLHVTLHMHHERNTYLSAMIPHTALFFMIPIASVFGFGGLNPWESVIILIGMVLYVSHLIVAFKELGSLSNKMRDARRQALQEKATAEQANEAKSTFLANMSHEIRTPMNGVLGMAEILAASDLNDEQRTKVQVIRESGDLLLSVLNDLLDLSKIEANEMPLEAAPFQLTDIAGQIRRMYQERAESRDIMLSVTCNTGCDSVFIGDAHRIGQIAHNLVNNALKFTHEGSVSVSFKAPPQGENGVVSIQVEDTGIGVPPEKAEHLFQPFTQADSSTTRQYGGTGLGLTIVRKLANAMGGDVVLQSSSPEGSTFVATLNLQKAATQTHTPMPSTDENANLKPVGSLKILVADDNHVNREIARVLLSSAGHTVYCAENGADALQQLEKETAIDIVLMDLSMPVMDGVETLHEIRRRKMSKPVVALSAHAMQSEIDKYLAEGFDGYIIKPVSADKLTVEINRVLQSRRNSQAA